MRPSTSAPIPHHRSATITPLTAATSPAPSVGCSSTSATTTTTTSSPPKNGSVSPWPANEAADQRPTLPPTDRDDQHMTDTPLDTLGPVDFVIVEFPEGQQHFTGEMIDELLKLVDAGTIRVIDVLILAKDQDGSVEAIELADVDNLGPLVELEADLAELLAEDDVEHLAAAMDPGSVAGVLVYENLWAAPFASAARRAGGELIANGRIPIQAIIAAVDADAALETEGA